MQYLNMKIKGKWVEIIDLNFVVNSNEMACRKWGRLGLYHVMGGTLTPSTYEMNGQGAPYLTGMGLMMPIPGTAITTYTNVPII